MEDFLTRFGPSPFDLRFLQRPLVFFGWLDADFVEGFEADTSGFLDLPPVPDADDLEPDLDVTDSLPPVPDDGDFVSVGFEADTTGFLPSVPDDDDVDETPDLD